MKVLLDENLPHALRHHLSEHDTLTARYMGWSGLKNGELLRAAEEAGIEVFVTADQDISYQQNMEGRKVRIVYLSANNWPVIKPHVAKIAAAINEAKPGAITRVDCGVFTRQRRPGP